MSICTVLGAYERTRGKLSDWEDAAKGVRNIGEAIHDHLLISSGTINWNITNNKAFGNNLKS